MEIVLLLTYLTGEHGIYMIKQNCISKNRGAARSPLECDCVI